MKENLSFDEKLNLAKLRYNRGHSFWHFFGLRYIGEKEMGPFGIIKVYYCQHCKKEIVK